MSIRRRLRSRRDERGYIAIMAAFFCAALMMPLCAISVDVSVWYVEVQRVQNAADAAATAGVTYLPDDFASAKATAITVAGRNGYPNSGTSSVSVSIGDKPTQLVVTIDSQIKNAFGSSFGVGNRATEPPRPPALNGPGPMATPSTPFGNSPPATARTGRNA